MKNAIFRILAVVTVTIVALLPFRGGLRQRRSGGVASLLPGE